MAQAYQSTRGVRAAPAPLRGQQRLSRPHRRERTALLRHLARRPPGRVRRIRRRRAPVHRRHPGAPRAEEQADAAASAVRRVRRRGAGLQGRRATAGRARDPAVQRCRACGVQNPCAVADHDFDTSTAKRSTSGRSSRCAPTRSRMPGGGTARREVVETLRRRRASSRWTRATTSRWSTSTAIRWAAGCGSCPRACSTSAARRRI